MATETGSHPPGHRPWRARTAQLVPLLLVLLVAAALRFTALGHVDRIHFDETYYANEAHEVLDRGVTENRPAHPPVGKWVIAAGIATFGFDPVGWRVGPAAAGTVTVLVTYGMGIVLCRRRWPAAAAALLVAVDGLAITTSRIALLDAVQGMFVALCALLVFRHHQRHRHEPRSGRFPPGWELWGAGLAAGLAIGTKWSSAPLLLTAFVVASTIEWRRRRASTATVTAIGQVLASVALPLVIVPGLVYLSSYSGFLLNYEDSPVYEQRCPGLDCPTPPSERLAALAWHHGDLVRMHRQLEHTHLYRSHPRRWPLMQRPVLSYLERCPTEGGCEVPEGTSARILMVGNPALWWAAAAAVPVLIWRAWRRRERAAALVAAVGMSLYVPWFLFGSGFVYYLTPVVPFAALAVVLSLTGTRWRVLDRVGPAAVVALALMFLALLFPLWYGFPLGPDALDARLLLESWR